MVYCNICKNQISGHLRRHITTSHNIESKEYYDTFLKKRK